MTFYSLQFLIFLSVVFVVYYSIPQKYRYIWLVAASIFFYGTYGKEYLLILFGVASVSYISARVIGKKTAPKIALFISIILLAGFLCFLRVISIWQEENIQISGVMIGVSFYTLVAIGYIIDVYNDRTECEKNYLKYLLFLSFFPIVLSGPIERSTNLLSQIRKGTVFSYENIKKGMLMALYGVFLKCLIADRMAVIVNALFDTYTEQTGAAMLFGIVLYGFQLYADFSGYSCIAIGIAAMFGLRVIENFSRPYFSRSIKEFWGRWHISLSSWLKDYIYIPLGGSRKGSLRHYINLMVVFLVSGLWHGNGLQFVVWGLLHGLYQVISRISGSYIKCLSEKMKIKKSCFSFRFGQILFTFFLVDFAWLFFRASSVDEAVRIIGIVLKDFQLGSTLENRLWLAGYNYERFIILSAEVLIWFVFEYIHEKGISVCDWLTKQNTVFRWCVYLFACLTVIIGLVYNYGTDAVAFIYTRF